MLNGNVPLTRRQKVTLRKYRKHLHTLAKKKLVIVKKTRVIQNGGFLSTWLTPLTASVLLPLLRHVAQQMEHARDIALVDPQLLETLPSPPPTDTVGKVVRRFTTEMTSILDRTDLDVREKLKLYNQILQRYNELVDRRIKQPTRVVVVNGDVAAAAAGCVEVDIAGSILNHERQSPVFD